MHSNSIAAARLATARERLLRFLVEGRRDLTEQDARCRLSKLGITDWCPWVCVAEVSLHLDMYPAESVDSLLIDIEDAAFRYLRRNGWRVWGYVDSRNSLILLLGSDSQTAFEQLDRMLAKLVEKLMTDSGVVIYAGIGSLVSEATKIKDSAKDAAMCIAYKYSGAGAHVINIRNIRKILADTTADHTTAFDRVIGCFLDGDMDKLRIRLTELLERLTGSNNRNQVTKQVYLELMAQVTHRAADAGIEQEPGKTSENLQHILRAEDLQVLRSWFEDTCEALITQIGQKRQESSSHIAGIARKYVEANYADHTLSQQSVSDHMGLSVGYFGQLFYSQTGQRFVDYLHEYRLEMAKELLLTTNGKIRDISEATGFNSVNYFNSLFKKRFSLTPKEFRSRQQG